MQNTLKRHTGLDLGKVWKIFGTVLFVYLFLGFMVLPCLNTLTSIFTTKDAAGKTDPLAVIRFFFAGSMPSFVGNSLPNFFVALLLIFVFAITLGWLPVISANIGKSGIEAISGPGIILPTATLAIAMASKYTRQIRATVLDELNKPYVAGARARGVPERTILVKHVLKSVMIMLVTLLALSIGDLLGGTAIVETIFQWDGVGKLAVDSITMRDYPMIQAYVVWMAIIYVVVNLIADLLYHYLDPRVRLGGVE